MWNTARAACLVPCFAAFLSAQSLKVYSEFQRPGPDGEIVTADRQPRSREILSPAVARNAHASFHVVVKVPPGTPFALHFAQNPENAVHATFYREIHDTAGVPERLEKVELPLEAKMGENQRAVVLWMDLFVEASAAVRRVRVEPQLWAVDRWVIYPLELRIMPAVVPALPNDLAAPLAPRLPADSFVPGPLRKYLCGNGGGPASSELSVGEFIQRNQLQDMALARAYERSFSRDVVVARVAAVMSIPNISLWCATQDFGRPIGAQGPEWYLRVRDLLLRGW